MAIGRFEPLLPLYGAFPALTGVVPRSADEIGFIGGRCSRALPIDTTVTRHPNATDSHTNMPND